MKYSGIIEQSAIIPVSSTTVLLFAIHPFNVESVAWLAASKILLYGLFYFLALYTYLFYKGSGRKVFYFLTLLLFSISLFAKEQAAILPLTLLLIDFILSGYRIQKQDLVEKLPFVVLSVFLGFVTMLAQLSDYSGVLSERAQYPFVQRIAFGAYSLFEYFVKCIIPVKLMYLYPFPNLIGEPLTTIFYFYPIFLLFFLILFFRYHQVKWLFFGGAFFIINLLMVLHIVPISRFAIVADRYVYVASVGACFLISCIMHKMVVKAKALFHKRIILAGCFVFAMFLAVYAYKRNLVWHSTETLKREIKSIIRARPDYKQLEKKYHGN